MVSIGACVSNVIVSVTVVVFPASSDTLTSMVFSPSFKSVCGVTSQLPFASTVVLSVCSTPFSSVITTVILVPTSASLVPEIVGVESLVTVSKLTVKLGPDVSIMPVAVSEALFPAASDTSASTE